MVPIFQEECNATALVIRENKQKTSGRMFFVDKNKPLAALY